MELTQIKSKASEQTKRNEQARKLFFSIKLIGHSIEWSGDGVEDDDNSGGNVDGTAGGGSSGSGGSDKCLNCCLVTPTPTERERN